MDDVKIKLGPWHPEDVNPVHVGWYEVKANSWTKYITKRYWDGTAWFSDANSQLPSVSGWDGMLMVGLWRGVLK